MKVFVYGTLKSGNHRNRYLNGSKLLCEIKTTPKYMLYQPPGVDYPCMAESDQGVAVEGELWDVPSQNLTLLDAIEGVPYLFHRQTIKLEDGTEADAYLMSPPPNAKQIGSKWYEQSCCRHR